MANMVMTESLPAIRNGHRLGFSRSLQAKMMVVALAVSLIPLLGIMWYLSDQLYWLEVRTAVGGLMNFADAKQQGIVRFLGQNEKLARQLAVLVDSVEPQAAQTHFATIVASDVFKVEDHPFADEIKSGQRRIPTWKAYHSIDFVRNSKVEISSDPARVGSVWDRSVDLRHGYSDVYLLDEQPIVTFGAKAKSGTVFVHANALMLTNIVTGEIGNLEGDMGAYYLAGVGKTFDYYVVNRDNAMITESRVFPNALLRQQGSVFPWDKTLRGARDPNCVKGTYATDAKVTTGCREAMGFYQGPSGKLMLGASMPFYDSEWTIVVEQEASELLDPLLALRDRLWMLVGLAVLAVVAAAFLAGRAIGNPIRQLVQAAEGIAAGEVNQRITARGRDEIGVMGGAFQNMMGYLREMADVAGRVADGHLAVRVTPRSDRDVLGVAFHKMVANLGDLTIRVNQATQQLSTATAEILAAASQHTSGANDQAAAITQTASTVDELRAAAEQTAHKVRSVAQQADESVRTSQEGAQAVETIVDGMRNIHEKVEAIAQDILALSEQSQRIGEITSTVDDIADRSNMLALNAAIEAAKAGEQGKGFAVVAAEVRNLAEQSKQATAQVRAILGDIQKATNTAVLGTEEGTKRVEEGLKLAERAGTVISQLSATIRDGAQAAQIIAASAQQQSVGIDQIAQAMAHIKQGTMQFVAGARQSQSAAEDLNRLAGQLRETMERYKLQ